MVDASSAHLRIVAQPAQEPQRHTRRAPCPPGDLHRAFADRNAQEIGGAQNDPMDRVLVVKVEAFDHAGAPAAAKSTAPTASSPRLP